jgi:ribosomal protein S10
MPKAQFNRIRWIQPRRLDKSEDFIVSIREEELRRLQGDQSFATHVEFVTDWSSQVAQGEHTSKYIRIL